MNVQQEPSASEQTGWESRPDPATHPMPPPDSPAEAWREGFAKLAEIRAYFAHFVAAKIDGIKVSLRNAGIYAALGVVGLIALAAVIATTVALLLVGIAGALGAAVGHVWLGQIITGVLMLILLGVGVMVGMGIVNKSFRSKTVQKYEERKRQERIRFGRDVEHASAGTDTAEGPH